MENIDIFESVFKRALREPFKYAPPRFETVTVLDAGDGDPLHDGVKAWLGEHPHFRDASWAAVNAGEYEDWRRLKTPLENGDKALVVTRRHLKAPDATNPYSLGAYVDAMLQDLPGPILVLPAENPEKLSRFKLDSVVAVADHLSGHHDLVNHAAALALPGGSLTLCHIEDEDLFKYYMDAIEKIPEINSAVAREKIRKQLLANPSHYIDSVSEVLKEERADLRLDAVVGIEHLIDRYRRILTERDAGMFVLESKDETQLATHSLGYSLAIEFNETPLLLL